MLISFDLLVKLSGQARACATDGLLPPYTVAERSREMRMRSRILRWRAQRTRDQSKRLLDDATQLRLHSTAAMP
jgi:hypothetical protein